MNPSVTPDSRTCRGSRSRSRRRYLLGALATGLVLMAGVDAHSSCERSAGLRAPHPPAAARSAGSSRCPGLASYEIVRATAEQARCSSGNVVTGGSCSAIGGGPSLDGAGWECAPGARATAICASLCSRGTEADGACCEGATCSVTTARDCASRHGVYLGDGAPCDGDVCAPRGACCLSSGGRDSCLDDTTPGDCAGMGGVYVGDGVKCDSDAACLACPLRPGCAPSVSGVKGSDRSH